LAVSEFPVIEPADPADPAAPVAAPADPAAPVAAPLVAAKRWWPRRWWGLVPVPLRHLVRLGIILLVIEYLVLPQIAGTRKAIHLLSDVDTSWLLLGVFLEAAALVAYAQLTRSVLPKRSDPGLGTMLRIQFSTLSVSHCVPGGTAAGSTLGYRLLTAAGVGRAETGFALATQGLGSAVVLNTIFWVALVVSIPVWGVSPLYVTAAVAGAIVIGAFIMLLLLFTRGEERAVTIIARLARRMPGVDEEGIERLFRQMSDRVRELAREPRTLIRATLWAAANWLLDAGSLYVFVGAFGHWVNPDGLLVAYGLANVLAALPITPGGLGVVETILTSALVGFDTTRGVALLGVLAYRLVNFWLPIPIGGLCYLSLQVRPGVAGAEARRKASQERREHLHRLMEVVVSPDGVHPGGPVRPERSEDAERSEQAGNGKEKHPDRDPTTDARGSETAA
jgi:uncharacterized protein (TIRG00374 family)